MTTTEVKADQPRATTVVATASMGPSTLTAAGDSVTAATVAALGATLLREAR